MSDYEYSSGIDSVRFILPKTTLLAFLKKARAAEKVKADKPQQNLKRIRKI